MTARKRRWFIYKDLENYEVAAIADIMDFADIVSKLQKSLSDKPFDLADRVELVEAIEQSLPIGIVWPESNCIEIFIKAADKFKVTAKSPKFFHNHDLYDTYSWVIHNIGTLKRFYGSDSDALLKNALVKCNEEIKEDVKARLYHLLNEMTERSDCSDIRGIHVIEEDEGLGVFFPVGEIYGWSNGYLESIVASFRKLKEEYPFISIQGLVYYYESIADGVTCAYFHCKAEDGTLSVLYDPSVVIGEDLEGEMEEYDND